MKFQYRKAFRTEVFTLFAKMVRASESQREREREKETNDLSELHSHN